MILDIEEEKGGIEVEISDGGRQKEVYYKLVDGVLSWMHTTYEIEEREYSTLPEGVRRFWPICQEAEWRSTMWISLKQKPEITTV